MLSCKEATRLLSLSQEQALKTTEKIKLRLHISVCKCCTNFEKNLKFMKKMTAMHMQRDDTNANTTRCCEQVEKDTCD